MLTLAWFILAAIAASSAAVVAWECYTAPIVHGPRVLYGGDLSTDEGWAVLEGWRDGMRPSSAELRAAIEAERDLTDAAIADFIDKETNA